VNVDGVALHVADGLFEVGAGSFVGHGVPVAIKLIGRHAVHPAGGGQSLGGQLDVAQTNSGPDVKLVRRLVCAESDIAIGPEHFALTELGLQLRQQRRHRAQHHLVVHLLVGGPVGRGVVGFQTLVELQRLRRPTSKRLVVQRHQLP